jgi:hypothetical protein
VGAHVEQAFSLASAPTSDYPPRPFAPRFFPRLRSQALRLVVRSLRIAGRKLPYRIGVYESVLPRGAP